MRARTFLAQLRRESRGSAGRLVFFVACLAIGVAAVVGVAVLAEGLDTAIHGQARQLLAADLAVRGRAPIPDSVLELIDAEPSAKRVTIREMLTIVAAPSAAGGRSQLSELKAVDGDYPFYGDLILEPPGPLGDRLGDDATFVQAALLRRLGLSVGDALRIGGEHFRIAGTVVAEPDRVMGALSRGPRIFISLAGLARTSLEQTGSLINHRVLVRLAADANLDTVAERLRAAVPKTERFRVETFAEAQPALRQGLRRRKRFVGLAALLSLLIGGVGVAQTVRAWIASRMDTIAVRQCVGQTPREILTLYLGQTVALALVGSLVGILGGLALQQVAASILRGLIPIPPLSWWQPAAIFQGLILGMGVALLFSVPPLLTAGRVPPIRVLRRDAEPVAERLRSRLGVGLLLAVGVWATAAWQARSPMLGLWFTAGMIVAAALLTLAAKALIRLTKRPRQRTRLWLRHGLAALGRPGAGTLAAVVALGLGVLVLVAMIVIEGHLHAQLDRDLPATAPDIFLIDIQPDQWPDVQHTLRGAGAERIDSVPVITARLAALDGESIETLVGDAPARFTDEEDIGDSDRRWALTREQRLTYLEALPDDNEIVDGMLWHRPDVAELSVEQDYAQQLGIGVDSAVRLDIQGVSLDLTVTSIRTVDWSTFGINFFMVVEPGVLDAAPQQRVAAAGVPRDAVQALQDTLAAAHPNITMIQIRDVLERIANVLSQLSLGIRLLGALTVLTGLAILTGAISASSVHRAREVALLKTLGMTRPQVTATYAVEYALIGLVAGIVGTATGAVLAWVVVTRAMEMTWAFPITTATLAPIAAALLATLAGLTASIGALRRRPIEVLRQVG